MFQVSFPQFVTAEEEEKEEEEELKEKQAAQVFLLHYSDANITLFSNEGKMNLFFPQHSRYTSKKSKHR